MNLTPREKICIAFLSNKMEATAKMVGVAICAKTKQEVWPGWEFNIGGPVLGNLRKKGLVMRLHDLRAWRLTADGREVAKRKEIVLLK